MRGVNSSKNSGKDGRGGVVWGRCSESEGRGLRKRRRCSEGGEGLQKEEEGEREGRG